MLVENFNAQYLRDSKYNIIFIIIIASLFTLFCSNIIQNFEKNPIVIFPSDFRNVVSLFIKIVGP